MILGLLALVTAAVFAGTADYIAKVEQPARLALGDEALLALWRHSVARGSAVQAPVAVLSGCLGAVPFIVSGWDWRWLAGATTMLAVWPFTLMVVAPVQHSLAAFAPDQAGAETRALIERWGRLHSLRFLLGTAGTALFLWAAARP